MNVSSLQLKKQDGIQHGSTCLNILPYQQFCDTPSCKMHCVVCYQQARAPWTDICGGYHNRPAEAAKWGHSSSRTCGHNIFPTGWCMCTYSECFLRCPVWCVH